jgi:hypothetical protein
MVGSTDQVDIPCGVQQHFDFDAKKFAELLTFTIYGLGTGVENAWRDLMLTFTSRIGNLLPEAYLVVYIGFPTLHPISG